ncbi:MAG: glutathionylspermidine synthase family protein [Longimicrobiales bacterium]
MNRLTISPRPDWRTRVESVGLAFHSGQSPYWNESACYELTMAQAELIETATNELHGLCLEAVQHVIDEERYAELKIPAHCVPLIRDSWINDYSSIYGRFDLSYDGKGPPKMLEYNADTPSSLLEAAVVQWHWVQEVSPHLDQFNSIHERLIAGWKDLQPHLPPIVHFTAIDDVEDGLTVTYLRETCEAAGVRTIGLPIEQVGWNGDRFVGEEHETIHALFKLYPWEWLLNEDFGQHIAPSRSRFIEPAWKMILSNKGILPILWELFEGHPNLLEAYRDPTEEMLTWGYTRKPLLSREGANIRIHGGTFGKALETSGEYGEEGYIYQRTAPLPNFDGNYPVIGSWVIAGESAGIGIREDSSPITTNTSRFVPHRLAAWR